MAALNFNEERVEELLQLIEDASMNRGKDREPEDLEILRMAYGEFLHAFHYNIEDFQEYVYQIQEYDWGEYGIEELDDFFCPGDVYSLSKNLDVTLEYGATKGVLIFSHYGSNLPYVLKFPRLHCENNYCKYEVEVYKAAVEAGVEGAFAECFYADEWFDIPFYFMETVVINDDEVLEEAASNTMSRDDTLTYDEVWEELADVSGQDYTLVKAFITEEDELTNFLWSNRINDLHCQNFGWSLDTGLPVMCDYSGY